PNAPAAGTHSSGARAASSIPASRPCLKRDPPRGPASRTSGAAGSAPSVKRQALDVEASGERLKPSAQRLLRGERFPLAVHLLETMREGLVLAGDVAEARAAVEGGVGQHASQLRQPRLRAADLSLELRQPLFGTVFPAPVARDNRPPGVAALLSPPPCRSVTPAPFRRHRPGRRRARLPIA